MQQELLVENSAYTPLSPDRKSRARYGVVALGLLATGAGIGYLGSSSQGLRAKSHTKLSLDADCHPWDGQTKKIFVNGYDSGDLEQWWSHNDDGHWMIARYSEWSDAAPLLFQAADSCGEYYLQDAWPGLSNLWDGDEHWLSFTTNGQWVRSYYASSDAAPIEFIAQGDGTYKMKNKWTGSASDLGGLDSDHLYFSYTDNVDYDQYGDTFPQRSVRTIYSEDQAMVVSVMDSDS